LTVWETIFSHFRIIFDILKMFIMMFKTLHIFTRKRFVQCKVSQVKVFCFLYGQSLD